MHDESNLFVKVDEPLRAVDVIESCEARHRAVDGHGMSSNLTTSGKQKPVRVRPCNEYAFVSRHVTVVAQAAAAECVLVGSFISRVNKISLDKIVE